MGVAHSSYHDEEYNMDGTDGYLTRDEQGTIIIQETVDCEEIEACGFSQKVTTAVTDLTSKVQKVTDGLQTVQKVATDGIKTILLTVNSIPYIVRKNTLNTTRVVAANMQALGDSIASAADRKDPPVSKQNLELYMYLKSKHPDVLERILTLSKSIQEKPSEERVSEVMKFSLETLHPLLMPN